MEKVAVYAGSFDPITLGHIDIIRRSSKFVDKLIIGVGENVNKKYCFDIKERIEMITNSVQELNIESCKFIVKPFDSLLVDFAKKNEASILVRGIRAFTDFDYEYQMAMANQDIDSEIETIFLIANKDHLFINSSLVKEIAHFKGDISKYVSKSVYNIINKKFGF